MNEEKSFWEKEICQTPLQQAITTIIGMVIAYFLIAVVMGLLGKKMKV